MSLTLQIKNGQILDSSNASKASESTGTGAKSAASKASKGTEFDKNMFLKLLAAEMQYQDPMSPTDNSQYVSEMATFSQVEATQNVSKSVDNISASDLVGKYVTISTDSGNVTGIVDYMTRDGDDINVTVNGKDYNVDNVISVKDSQYYEATQAALTLSNMIAALPDESKLTLSDEKNLTAASELYNSFSSYTKQFISGADQAKLNSLTKKMAELKKNSD